MFLYLVKGAVIASDATPDKNKLSTDTLTYSDIQNKAEYSASSTGVNVNTAKDARLNEKGITPNIGVKASGDADSTTKSAIAPGTIEVRSNPDQDLSKLSRDPSGSLNTLGKIFDKQTVQEQQELANLFGELAFKEVHKISKANGWDEGSPQKIALHAFVGAVMADLGGGNALSGAVGAGLNEAVQKELKEKFKDNPDMHQWASAIIGAAAAKAAGGDAQTGGSTAASGTKNNLLLEYLEPVLKPKLNSMVSKDTRDSFANNQYTVIAADGGELIQGRLGVAVDKFGNVFELIGIGAGGSVLPATLNLTMGIVADRDGKSFNRDSMRNAMEGISIGFSAQGIVQGGVSASISFPPTVTAEAGGATNAGVGVMVVRAKYIFNLND